MDLQFFRRWFRESEPRLFFYAKKVKNEKNFKKGGNNFQTLYIVLRKMPCADVEEKDCGKIPHLSSTTLQVPYLLSFL